MRLAAGVASFSPRVWIRRVPWIGALLIAAIVATAVWDTVRGYRMSVDDTGRELETQARIIAEQAARSVQAVDVVLRHVAAEYRRGRLARLGPDELHAYLRELSVGLKQIDGFGLYDADGKAVAQSWLPAQTTLRSIAELPGFGKLRDDPTIEFGIDNATRGMGDGVWSVPLGRRLETAAGEFGGVVGARGLVDYFQHFYRDVQLGRGTTVTLMHGSGTLLARFPPAEDALGKRFALFDGLLAQRAEAQPGLTRIASPVDGSERFAVLRWVPDYPLAVIVTRQTDVALAAWRQQALGTAARTLALGLLAALLLALVTRQLRRLDTTRESLEATRERFALAVAGSDDGIWDWDQKTDLVFASARARELYGLPPGPETQPREAWFVARIFHPDDAPRRLEAMDAHMAGLTPSYEGEYRVLQADGRYRWVRIRGLCIRDANGEPLRMAGSVSDIDARKRAEEALRQSEERYALAMAGSNEGHWVWDVNTDQLYASPKLNEIYGLPGNAQITSMSAHFAQLPIHPDDKARVMDFRIGNMAADSSHFEIEYRIVMPASGEIRWIAARGQCFRGADGAPERFAGSNVDVTKRKRMEEALRESEERYALAVAGSDDGVWDWDFVAGLAFESKRARELQGLPPGPELQPLPSLLESLRVHPDDAPRRAEGIRAHLAGETPAYECEYRVRHGGEETPRRGEVSATATACGSPQGGDPRGADYRWVRIRALCIRDASGKPVRMAGSVSDIDARKRVEESLRQSEERYEIAMTGSNEGHWVWDVATDELFASPSLHKLFGLASSVPLTTMRAFDALVPIHADDHASLHQAIDDHLAGRTPHIDLDYRVMLPDGGGVRWVHSRGQCFRDAEGRPLRVAGATVDISDRKRAEEALRESEQRSALAIAGSNDGIMYWDIERDSMFMSERAMRISGFDSTITETTRTHAEWVAMLDRHMHPDDRPRRENDLRAQLEGHLEVRDGEYRMRHFPDGNYRWVRVRGICVRDAGGRPLRWAGSVSDIDAQKRAEEALRESEQRYELAVAGSNEGMWDWDMRRETFFFSARAQELLGLEPREPMRPCNDWWSLFRYHPDDEKRVQDALAAYLGGAGKHWEVEYRIRHQRSGDWHWYRERGVALRDAAGEPYRMAGSLEDISERKHAEAERNRLEGQLRQSQKLEAMGTLAGGIAHDFNNILAAILGYGEMAQKDASEGTAQRRHIDAALSAGMRAKSLVERILAFSRSGMAERVPVHVGAVVDEALDLVVASLPRGVRLARELAIGDAAVLGDATQIHQVVMNLCANAVQSMKSSGTLAVSVGLLDADEPHCVATAQLPAGRYVRLVVRDSGSGIAPRLLERIFDPFFTTKEVGVGTGLGLSLVHGIVTDLGGGVDVHSQVGAGSTFTVLLPWQGNVAAPRPLEEPLAGSGAGETVLLVDDEEALVRLGEEMMAELGYEAVGFASSAAALATFRESPDRFDVVLSDEAMPEMTGSELAREIRRLRPDIPIVLMTGYVTPALSARARDAGVCEVLAKPLVARDIARSLAGALAGRKTAALANP